MRVDELGEMGHDGMPMGEKDEEQREKIDYKDVENGPLDEANRECRDVICCILFIANLCAMIYVTAHAYATGNPNKIYRGVSVNSVPCGSPGGTA